MTFCFLKTNIYPLWGARSRGNTVVYGKCSLNLKKQAIKELLADPNVSIVWQTSVDVKNAACAIFFMNCWMLKYQWMSWSHLPVSSFFNHFTPFPFLFSLKQKPPDHLLKTEECSTTWSSLHKLCRTFVVSCCIMCDLMIADLHHKLQFHFCLFVSISSERLAVSGTIPF